MGKKLDILLLMSQNDNALLDTEETTPRGKLGEAGSRTSKFVRTTEGDYDIAPTGRRKGDTSEHTSSTKKYMELHNERLLSLLREQRVKKREVKRKRKIKEEKEAPSLEQVNHSEFNSDIFDNMKIARKDIRETQTAPSNGGSNLTKLPPVTQLFNEKPSQPAIHHNGNGTYDNKILGYDIPMGNFHQGPSKNFQDPREDLFVISKHT